MVMWSRWLGTQHSQTRSEVEACGGEDAPVHPSPPSECSGRTHSIGQPRGDTVVPSISSKYTYCGRGGNNPLTSWLALASTADVTLLS